MRHVACYSICNMTFSWLIHMLRIWMSHTYICYIWMSSWHMNEFVIYEWVTHAYVTYEWVINAACYIICNVTLSWPIHMSHNRWVGENISVWIRDSLICDMTHSCATCLIYYSFLCNTTLSWPIHMSHNRWVMETISFGYVTHSSVTWLTYT